MAKIYQFVGKPYKPDPNKKWLYNRKAISKEWLEAAQEKGWEVGDPFNPRTNTVDVHLKRAGGVGVYRTLKNGW